MGVLVRGAEVSNGRVRDLRLADGRIIAVEPSLPPLPNEDVLEAHGCAVLPGLHDHHVHLRAQAAATQSVNLAAVADEAGMRAALRDAQQRIRPGAWLRVVGYHESLAGELDRALLDDLTVGATPLRVQHRTGVLWVLNSAGLAAAAFDAAHEEGIDLETGQIWRRDDLIRRISELDPADLARVGAAATALGITGLTDATPGVGTDHAVDLARALRAAGVTQNLHLMGPVGCDPPDVRRATLGPVKVLLDDHDLPPLEQLVDTTVAAHAEQRSIAFHCVTRVQLTLAVAALEMAGARAGDRIEHGSVIPPEMIPTVAALGVTVVTQPHFLAERGDDYRRDVDALDQPSLYRVRSLQDAGIPVAAGTDAPYGAFDPWASIAAAVERTTRSGNLMGEADRVDLATAIGLYVGHAAEPARRRTADVGQPADLCILTVSWRELPEAAADRPIRHTIIDGTPAVPHRL